MMELIFDLVLVAGFFLGLLMTGLYFLLAFTMDDF